MRRLRWLPVLFGLVQLYSKRMETHVLLPCIAMPFDGVVFIS